MSARTSSIVPYDLRYIRPFFNVAKKLSTHELSYGQAALLMLPVIPFLSRDLITEIKYKKAAEMLIFQHFHGFPK